MSTATQSRSAERAERRLVYMSSAHLRGLKALARKRRTSMAAVIRSAFDQALAGNGKKGAR